MTGECIGLERICDDHVDCANGADEEPHLCRHSPTTNTSNTIGSTSVQQALIAQRFAAQVAREAVKEAVATAVSRVESRLRTLLTYVLSALLGPLLIVLTVGLMCRSSAASAAAGRRSADEARRARQRTLLFYKLLKPVDFFWLMVIYFTFVQRPDSTRQFSALSGTRSVAAPLPRLMKRH